MFSLSHQNLYDCLKIGTIIRSNLENIVFSNTINNFVHETRDIFDSLSPIRFISGLHKDNPNPYTKNLINVVFVPFVHPSYMMVIPLSSHTFFKEATHSCICLKCLNI